MGLSFLIFTGFTEELVFRGLLQSLSLPIMGRFAFVYVSLLFAVMHIGYRSLADLVFVFTVGLYFAFVVQWSGSILGVSLAHGVTNTTLFVVMPDLMQHGSIQSRIVLGLAVLWGTILAGISTIHFNISWRATELRRLRGRLPQRCDAPTVILHDQQIPI
jgi:hypothetical protein